MIRCSVIQTFRIVAVAYKITTRNEALQSALHTTTYGIARLLHMTFVLLGIDKNFRQYRKSLRCCELLAIIHWTHCACVANNLSMRCFELEWVLRAGLWFGNGSALKIYDISDLG